MTCPDCGSTNTRKPSVRHPEWRCGQQWCDDCGFRGDWVLFVKGLDPAIEAKAVAYGDAIRKVFEDKEKG